MSQPGMKRNAEGMKTLIKLTLPKLFPRLYKHFVSGAGLDMMDAPESSDEDSTDQKPLIPGHLGEHEDFPPGAGRGNFINLRKPIVFYTQSLFIFEEIIIFLI